MSTGSVFRLDRLQSAAKRGGRYSKIRVEDGSFVSEFRVSPEAAAEVMTAIETSLASFDAQKTPDLGGKAKTKDIGKALVDALS